MKIAAMSVLCAMMAATVALPGRASAGSNSAQGMMNVVLDTQNNLLTITIVSDDPWDSSMNFTIAPEKVLMTQMDEASSYQGLTPVEIKEKTHKEVYNVIPKHKVDGDGVTVRFGCNQTGLAATFLDDHTAQLGPFHVSIDGFVTGDMIPLDMRPIQIEPN